MSFLIIGFLTSLSLILAIGPQNIFVIEQGIKKQYIFLICLICSVSDMLLIFLGIFLFEYFGNYFNNLIELIFNFLLLIFLIYFILSKINENFDLSPRGIREMLNLNRPIYEKTAAYGHFGRNNFSWEQININLNL